MYYLIFTTEDGEVSALYGGHGDENFVIDKLVDYVEVGVVTGKGRVLSIGEIECIRRDKMYLVDGLTGWRVVQGRKWI